MPKGVYKRTKPAWNKDLTKETDSRIKSTWNKIPVETRLCKCFCGDSFECRENSDQRFIYGHHRAGESHTKVTKEKQSVASLKRKKELGYINSPETRDKMSTVSKENWKDSEFRKVIVKAQREGKKDSKWGEQHSRSMILLWKDPKYKEKTLKAQFEGRKLSPNKPEAFITKLLNELLPNEYKFVGDGKFWIESCNPDFVNINGQKKIIELYGDYWHANKDFCKKYSIGEIDNTSIEEIHKRDKERINTFSQYGYQTLIIWEYELGDIDKLKDKILEFQRS